MTKTTKPTRRSKPKTVTGSVITPEFRAKYDEHGGNVGDALAKRLAKHLAAGDGGIDPVKLEAFARANDVWQGKYKDLNIGMQRMNIRNRLAAKVRHGHKIVWN